jgi:HTH-type transcriptional repressor of NAD biosynthesis genes
MTRYPKTKRILVIGAESSGKTTFCEALSEALGVPWIPEYGRKFGEKTGNVYKYEDMLHIAETQTLLEDVVTGMTPIVICDTSPLVTSFYSLKWYGKVDSKLADLALRQYDLVFFCARDFDYVDDGSRNGEEFGMEQEKFYKDNLAQPYIMLWGSVEQRVEYALKQIEWNGI